MKKILLLFACTYFVTTCKAQQKELDSLLNELKKHSQQDTIKLKLLLEISNRYANINAGKGVSVSLQAIALSKKLNAKNFEGTAYNYIAQNYQTLGNDSLAIAYCILSFNIKKQLNDSTGMAIMYHTMGVSYFTRSDYYTALKYEQQAAYLFKLKKDSAKQAAALNSIGVNYQYLGDYPKALQYYQKAISIWEQTGEKKLIANALTNTGLIYGHINDYNKALAYHKKALQIHESTGNKAAMADCYGNIANVYDEQGDTTNARMLYKKDLQLSAEISYEFGIASASCNLGISYTNVSDYDNALKYLPAALQKFTNLGNRVNMALIFTYLSYVYMKAPVEMLKKYNMYVTNKLDKAIQLQMQGIRLYAETHNTAGLIEAYENLSDIYEAQKNYMKALDAYKQSIVYKDSVLNDDKKQQITRLEMQYDFNKTQDSVKAINDKQQALATAEIQKQRIVKNSILTGAVFLILAGIGGFVFYKRNRDIKIQKNEAELKEQITDTEMKALRAQMNPHFIFNSLNSIADYIDKNQTQIASDFTAKFAKLMRMVLENSEQKEIPLADDLKALELYMQLESLRLKNKFTYRIKVDESIDKENTLVPPLILQPFVENSIWHGIAKKEGAGHITIYIKQEENMINCSVEDDGGGMKETVYAGDEKKSLGMKITKARIDIINKIKNADASMNVSNKENGVRAEVKLPLELSF